MTLLETLATVFKKCYLTFYFDFAKLWLCSHQTTICIFTFCHRRPSLWFVRKYEIKNFLQGDLQDFQHGGFWLLWNFSMALNIHQRASFIFFGNIYEISNLLIVPSSEILNGFAQLSKMCILVNLGLPMALQTHRGVAFNFRRHIK